MIMNIEQATNKKNVSIKIDIEKSKGSAVNQENKEFVIMKTENTKAVSWKLVNEDHQVQHAARGGISKRKVERLLETEDRATRPIATLCTPRKKKLRGKPKTKTIEVVSQSRKQATTPKVGNRGEMRGGATISESKWNSISKRNEITKKVKASWSFDSNLKKRIKTVKSRLFKETKCFVAYKQARLKRSEERKKKLATKARTRKTQQKYADRKIDFSKRSRRKRQAVSKRQKQV